MQPYRKVVRRQRGEKRFKLRLVKRVAVYMGEDLNPPRAKRLDGAVHFFHGRIHVMQGKRGDERRESGGMAAHHVSHRVVRNAREIAPLGWSRDRLERWIGYRKNLPVVAERIHRAKPRLQVMQFTDRRHSLHKSRTRP